VVGVMWKLFGWLPGLAFVAMCLAASSIFGLASFYGLELPMRKVLRRFGTLRTAMLKPA
jgi:peptidoglycan/LPS O-acetylase OafA/YrhL